MFAVIRRTRLAADSTITADEALERINGEIIPKFTQLPGFEAYYAVNLGNNEVATISIFQTREQAEDTTRIAKEWAAQNKDSFGSLTFDVAAGEVQAFKTATRGTTAGLGGTTGRQTGTTEVTA